MKPLLAHIYDPSRITTDFHLQPKLNGIRALYWNGHFQSRDELPFPPALLRHLTVELQDVFSQDFVLDGELYVHGWPLQRINAAVTPIRNEPTDDTLLVEYHIFDRVDKDVPFADRFAPIIDKDLHLFSGRVRCVSTYFSVDFDSADLLYSGFVSTKYEGAMYRIGDCPYTSPKQIRTANWNVGSGTKSAYLSDKDNRAWHLLKRKDWQDDEFICVDVVEGEGKYAGTLGALVCLSKSNERFNVGSGLSDSERNYYWQNPPIMRKIKVKYLVLSVDGIPLNPTILCVI